MGTGISGLTPAAVISEVEGTCCLTEHRNALWTFRLGSKTTTARPIGKLTGTSV